VLRLVAEKRAPIVGNAPSSMNDFIDENGARLTAFIGWRQRLSTSSQNKNNVALTTTTPACREPRRGPAGVDAARSHIDRPRYFTDSG
jgi:hypothetical protein